MKFLIIALCVSVSFAEYLWHDVNVVKRTIYTNCSDTQMDVIIDDPAFGILNDSHSTGGEVYIVWYDTTDTRQQYLYDSLGDDSSGFVCDGGVTLIHDQDYRGLIRVQFLATTPTDAELCGATITTEDLDGDGTDDVFNWTSPIITLKQSSGISLGNDIHVYSRCTYQTKATVQSVDIGAAGRQPELVTDTGSLFADLTLTVYKIEEGTNGQYVQFNEVMDGELVPVGMKLAAVIDLERNFENDDVGIKHFSCWAEDPYSVNRVRYGMIANGCPDIGTDNTHIGDDVNVEIELSSGVTRLMFYYNQFALGALYRLYCTVEMCQPSVSGDCDSPTEAACRDARRKRRQVNNDQYQTLNYTLWVYSEDDRYRPTVPTPTDQVDPTPAASTSCTTAPEFIIPLCILGALLLILLIVCACMLRKLHSKDEQIEKFTYMSSSSPYPASYKA